MQLELITEAAGVEAAVAAARAAGRSALDFEFLWEKTYAPLPCLAQLAVGERIFLIDPIAGAPLAPVGDLVADPEHLSIMHAPTADLALLDMSLGTRPANLLDVQLMAGFVGLGAGQGLGTLLERVLKVRLDKSERYTDWSKRPLSRRQIEYGAADVAHLLELADELGRRAAAMGRDGWVAEEHARRYGPHASFVTDPDEAWRRVKGHGRLSPRDRAVLAAVAGWREREARRRDKPVGWLIPDRTLVEIARRRPADRNALEGERGLPSGIRGAEADSLLAAIRAGEAADPIALEGSPRPDLGDRLDVLGPLGAVLVSARAQAVDLAPSLVANRDDISGFIAAALTGDLDGHTMASGWRYELAGAALIELAEGRLALAADATRPYLREMPGPNGGGDG